MKSYGALLDVHDPNDKPVSAFIAKPSTYPTTLDFAWTRGNDGPRNQGATSACTGFSTTKAAQTWARAHGIACDELSPLLTYFLGRWVGRGAQQYVTDSGAFPRDVSFAMQRYGFVPAKEWPFDTSKVNVEPDWQSIIDACSHQLEDFVRVQSSGGQISEDIRQCLGAGYVGTLTIVVDQSFEDHSGSSEIGLAKGPILGSHRLPIIGYRPGAVKIENSWNGWGDDGYAWLSDALIESSQVQDIEFMKMVSL